MALNPSYVASMKATFLDHSSVYTTQQGIQEAPKGMHDYKPSTNPRSHSSLQASTNVTHDVGRLSCVTASWMPVDQDTATAHLERHLNQPVKSKTMQ